MEPLISITIPAYKKRFLKETIESCLKQTYSNIELIIVDDASPEDLASVARIYDDRRIKYYRNEKNCGALNVVDNWNICLGYCEGEYVICMGDDDILLPCCIEEYVKLINEYPTLNVYHAWTEIIDDEGTVIRQLEKRPKYQGCMEMIWNHWNGDTQYIGDFCFRVDHLRNCGGFYKQPLAWASDDITTARAAAFYGIANTQNVSFQYRENPFSISSGQNNRIKIEAKLLEREWFRTFLNQELSDDYNESEKVWRNNLLEIFDTHFVGQILLYVKKYLHESLFNIFVIIKNRKSWGVKLLDVLYVFLKVAQFEVKQRAYA